MMKRILIVAIAVMNAIAMMAQKNHVKIGGGFGSVPYEGTPGWNIELQYEYKIVKHLSGFLSLGLNGGEFTSSGRSRGNEGTETWDNSWAYQYSEKFNYIDLGLRYQLLKIGEKYKMKAAVGSSFAQSVLKYPEDIYINKGIIEQQRNVTRKVEAGMLLLGIDNCVSITKRVSINLTLNYRTSFNKKHELTREVKYHYGKSSTTSAILNVLNGALQFGYYF